MRVDSSAAFLLLAPRACERMKPIRATLLADANDMALILEALVCISVQQRRANQCPSLYDTAKAGKAVYVAEKGFQTLRSARQTHQIGWGDCKHYSVWLAADLRAKGDVDARVHIKRITDSLFHAQVIDGAGVLRDPSKILGMGRK